MSFLCSILVSTNGNNANQTYKLYNMQEVIKVSTKTVKGNAPSTKAPSKAKKSDKAINVVQVAKSNANNNQKDYNASLSAMERLLGICQRHG